MLAILQKGRDVGLKQSSFKYIYIYIEHIARARHCVFAFLKVTTVQSPRSGVQKVVSSQMQRMKLGSGRTWSALVTVLPVHIFFHQPSLSQERILEVNKWNDHLFLPIWKCCLTLREYHRLTESQHQKPPQRSGPFHQGAGGRGERPVEH